MTDAYHLFDSRLKKTYLASGNFRTLSKTSTLRVGKRNIADKFILSLQSWLKLSGNREETKVNVEKCLGQPIRSLLLYDTSWYKETSFIGYAETTSGIFFVKIYKDQKDAVFQQRQSDFIQQHFSDDFVVTGIIHHSDNIIIYPYVPHRRVTDNICDTVIAINQKFIAGNAIQKLLTEVIPGDLFAVMDNFCFDLSAKIHKWLSHQSDTLTLVPVHGDLTPWNVGLNKNKQIILFDHEQAKWHVPFYDYFHYILQPLALKNSLISILDTRVNLSYGRSALILYLVDQLYYAVKRQSHYSDRFLGNLIKNKAYWLMELIGDL